MLLLVGQNKKSQLILKVSEILRLYFFLYSYFLCFVIPGFILKINIFLYFKTIRPSKMDILEILQEDYFREIILYKKSLSI